ncbi:MAG TPA: VCBS repeat-containing protein, partial [Myxococcales bacterium]|nr:VCBS repeat-containing protein [Myxococcales bacterium]
MKWKIIAALAGLGAAGFVALKLARPAAKPAQPPFDMKAKLASIAQAEGVWDNQWDRPKEKIEELKRKLQEEKTSVGRFRLRREIARHQLYDGANDAAIAELRAISADYQSIMPPPVARSVKAELAFAWFRLGETENCSMHHNAESCLLPVQGKGVHQMRRGSTEAVKLYGELLDTPGIDAEDALTWKWLLNLGYMTLGGYPGEVPRQWLIPPETFKSDYDIGRFEEVAQARGISEFGAAGGVIVEDFDNDGHLDVLVSHMGIADQLEYFHNDGNGSFTNRTKEAGLTGIVGGLNMFQA